jgi:hypothetical protein
MSQFLDDERDAESDLAAAKEANAAGEISFVAGSCNDGEGTKIAFKRCATIMNTTEYCQACDKYPLVKATRPLYRVMVPTDLDPAVDEECFFVAYDLLFVGLRAREITHYRRSEHARNLMSLASNIYKNQGQRTLKCT